ncbi:MAG: tetratricopeptide repeat protein [Ignavibacteriales bacterium]|nr:tetratricopeptide repeat protein [Ignavibacteriales bacterium]
MNRHFLVWLTAALLASLVFQGYQCGSPEFTGAKVYIQQKNYKEAIRLLEQEVQKNPSNEEAWYMLGSLKAENSDYLGMNLAFDSALKIDNKHSRDIKQTRFNKWGSHLNNAVGLMDKASGDSSHAYYDKAIGEFQKAIAAWPDTSLSYRYLGYAYSNKGDLEGALNAYRQAWDRGKDADALKRIGRIYLQRGVELRSKFETDNATPLREMKSVASVQKGMKKVDVMHNLGAPDNVKKGPRDAKKEDWAYKNFNLTVSLENDVVAATTFSRPYKPSIDSTQMKLALVEFGKSVEALEVAKNEDAKDNEILTLLLQAYVESNKIKEAITTFKQAVANEPGEKRNHYLLGVLYRTDNDFQPAIDEFKKAIEIDPAYTDAAFEVGATYYNWGVDILHTAQDKGQDPPPTYKEKFQQALPYLETVAETKKDDAQVWETLGTIYARLGMSDKALKALNRADKIRKGD